MSLSCAYTTRCSRGRNLVYTSYFPVDLLTTVARMWVSGSGTREGGGMASDFMGDDPHVPRWVSWPAVVLWAVFVGWVVRGCL